MRKLLRRRVGFGLLVLAGLGMARPAAPQEARRSRMPEPAPAKRVTVRFPFRTVDVGQPVVRVRVNGSVDASFLLDTGSTASLMTERLFGKLRSGLMPAEFGRDTWRLPGEAEARYARVESLELGRIHFRTIAMRVVETSRLPAPLSAEIDGILGNNLLDRMAVGFDFRSSVATLTGPGALDAGTLAELGFGQAVPIPLEEREGYRLYQVTAGLSPAVREALVVDTGAAQTTISGPAARGLSLPDSRRGLQHAAFLRTVTSNEIRLPRLLLGSEALNDVEVRYSVADESRYEPQYQDRPCLGLNVLRQFRVLLDYPAKKLYLQPYPLTARS